MRPSVVVLGVIGIISGVVAIRELSDATLSTHTRVASDSRIELVVDVAIHGGETGQSTDEMVAAQIFTCRLEVHSDVVGEVQWLGDGRFRAVLTPTMDRTDRRQFRGCLEDWIIDHIRLDVVRLETIDS